MEQIALFSVFYKKGIEDYGEAFVRLGWKIFSSGGTAKALAAAGVPVTDISELTGMKAILGHRVVTLHPKVEGGILARRIPEDEADLREYDIPRISHVCVDPYPAPPAAADPLRTILEVLDLTDIGGPTMIRAAAKNFPHGVSVVCDPVDRALVISELETYGHVREMTRAYLAFKVFATMTAYDGAIAARLGEDYSHPFFYLSSMRATPLRYGENPGQKPAYLFQISDSPLAIHNFQRLEGEPGYVNLTDVYRGLENLKQIVRAFKIGPENRRSIALGLKHGNCCGAAIAGYSLDAINHMIAGQPADLFGGVVITNFAIDEQMAIHLRTHLAPGGKRTLDVVAAPDISPEAQKVLSRKGEKCKLMVNPALAELSGRHIKPGRVIRDLGDDILVQPGNDFVLDFDDPRMERLGTLSESQVEALLFAWAIGSTSDSNTITLIKEKDGICYLIGNGVKQTSRVGAASLAIANARAANHDTVDSVAYSDSFFPFVDGLETLALAGVTAVFATSGSIRDTEIAEYCGNGLALRRLPDAVARGFFNH